MINVDVFSEEKNWSTKLKKKEVFFNKVCKAFPKKYKFLKKKVSLTLLLSNNKKIKNPGCVILNLLTQFQFAGGRLGGVFMKHCFLGTP